MDTEVQHYTYAVKFDDGSSVHFAGIGIKQDGDQLIILRADGGSVIINFGRVRWVEVFVG